MIIYLVRHGLTSFNLTHKIQGRLDIELCDEGIQTVKNYEISEHLKALACYSSPLKRAIQTAELCDFTPIIEPALIEMDWGNIEGKKLKDCRKKYGIIFANEEKKGLDFNFGGQESPRMVQKRAWDFIKTLKTDSVIFTHKGVIRALYARATHWDMKNKPPIKLKNDCIHSFNVLENNQLEIHILNDPLIKNVSYT